MIKHYPGFCKPQLVCVNDIELQEIHENTDFKSVNINMGENKKSEGSPPLRRALLLRNQIRKEQ